MAEQFLQAPGMDWVRPPPLGDFAVSRMPAQDARRISQTLARERLSRLQGDKVEAEIGRIHALTAADLETRRLGHAGQRSELAHLREKYPLLIDALEQDLEQGKAAHDAEQMRRDAESGASVALDEARLGAIGAATDAAKRKAAAELGYLEKRYPMLLKQLDLDIAQSGDKAAAEVRATDALANARNAAAAGTAAGAADDARYEAERLRQLQGRYPGLLDLDAAKVATQQGAAEANEALAHQRMVGAGVTAAGAADDARMAAEELRQLQGRYPGILDLDAARVATEQGAAEANEALAHQRMVGAGATAAGAAQDAMTAGIERGALPAQLAAELDSERALAEMRRARGQAALGGPGAVGGTPGGGVDPLNPYSSAANRWNDDMASMVEDLYGPAVMTDVVTGEPMIGMADRERGEVSREERKLDLMRAAQNIAALSLAAGQPMSPQEAVNAAVQALRGEGQGQAPGHPGAPPSDPLGILGGT